MTISLSIHLPNLPVFLFAQWPLTADNPENARHLTTLRGDIQIQTDTEIEVGALRLVWEVSVEELEHGEAVNRKVLDSYEARVGPKTTSFG